MNLTASRLIVLEITSSNRTSLQLSAELMQFLIPAYQREIIRGNDRINHKQFFVVFSLDNLTRVINYCYIYNFLALAGSTIFFPIFIHFGNN